MPKNIMVDLETLGTVPGCAILSIGAVEFDERGALIKSFYTEIYTPSCLDVYMSIDPATETWWRDKEPAARVVLENCADSSKSIPIKSALDQFAGWVKDFDPNNVLVWGNGSDFDNAILAVAYELCGEKLPWKFYNNRCYRTLKNLHPDIRLERVGTYHNALDDAVSQANHAGLLLKRQDDCSNLWGEYQDDAAGEGTGATVQQTSAPRSEGAVHQADATGNRLPRQNVPVGI